MRNPGNVSCNSGALQSYAWMRICLKYWDPNTPSSLFIELRNRSCNSRVEIEPKISIISYKGSFSSRIDLSVNWFFTFPNK
jgi:hypothetical protein